MAKLFLGVDGGQSSTTALIGDETGRVVGFGRGGPCNHVGAAEGRAKFLHAIGGCVGEALRQAGAEGARFGGACLGFSGGPADKEALVRELVSAEHIFVTHDALIGQVGACAGEPGLITIAGTGSIAFGRNAEGRTARAGGWGYIFGDEGGAFDIVRQALRAALRFEEGWGPSTSLRAVLLAATGTNSANEMLHAFYTSEWPRQRVAKMSKLVDDAAREGDEAARMILDHAAQQLSWLANAVREQLFTEGEPARVAYIGGVFRSEYLLEQFRIQVEVSDPANRFGPPTHGPAAGALLEAYRVAGVSAVLSGVPESEK
jgi:N-acetylglucosamine kinase-like BadF-type ATPase